MHFLAEPLAGLPEVELLEQVRDSRVDQLEQAVGAVPLTDRRVPREPHTKRVRAKGVPHWAAPAIGSHAHRAPLIELDPQDVVLFVHRYGDGHPATHICRNKSSLATILANPSSRGVKVFNRETRVEGEHGRKRRRNGADEVVTSEVDPIVPEPLWNRVQELLARRREHRLAPQRYAGGYVLTDILRCAGGARMAGTNSRSYRYYRCVARCGRPHVRAGLLGTGVMDLIRRTLITPKAIPEMIDAINEHGRLLAANQAPELQRVQRQIASLEKQDANLRRALRTARPNAAERITLEIDQVAAEIREAVVKRDDLEQVRKPLSTSKRFVQQTMDEMTGLIDNAALDTRVAWVRDLMDRVTVDGREEHAVAIWRTASDDGVNRSDSVSSWLRR